VSKEEIRLDELLARGSLGGPRYDEIFERVMERHEASEPTPTRKRDVRWLWVPLAALVPILALWVVPRSSHQPFTSKGALGPANPAVDISCGPAGGRSCRAGDVLMFTVNAAAVSGYLGAFAERIDDPQHDRIWYFSDRANEPPLVAPGTATVVVPQGIRIGPDHRAGKYRVTAWIASRPLDRGEIDGAPPQLIRSRSILDFEVVP